MTSRVDHNSCPKYLYQTYQPSGSKNPQIQELEKKINQLIQKLRSDESNWIKPNPSLTKLTEDFVDSLISQRDKMLEIDQYLSKGEALEQEGNAAASDLKTATRKYKKVLQGGTAGFVGGGMMAHHYELGTDKTIAAVGFATLIGAYANNKIN